MNCADARRWLHEYIDGETNPMQERMLKAHLRECGECRARFRALRETHAALSALESVPVPEGGTERVMQALPDNAFSRKTTPWYRKRAAWYTVAAAAVLALLLFGAVQALVPQSVGQPVVIAEGTSTQLVRENGVLRLPEGEILEGDITVVGGTLVVAGTIRGNITTVRASLVETETAHISGDVITSESRLEAFWYSARAAWQNLVEILRGR